MIWRFSFYLLTGTLAIAAGDASAGKAVYDKACKACHGATGVPNAAIAKTMKVTMASLSDPAVQSLSDDELKAVVTSGKGKMKPVKSVSGKAMDDVVAYVRTFKK
jgi:mono/diheme cytochrome c family protein